MTTTEDCEEAHKGASVALWRAVITQAFTDACNDNKGAALDRQQARAWLLGTSPDFAEVCALALLEPDHVRRLAVQRIEDHDNPKPIPIGAIPPAKNGKAGIYTFDGKSMTLREWSAHTGLKTGTMHGRLALGLPLAEVFKPGIRPRRRKHPPNDYRRIPQ